jgi:hypothetical protein
MMRIAENGSPGMVGAMRAMRSMACALAAAALLTWIGCSSPTSSKAPKTACNCEKDGGGSVIKNLTGPDTLVKTAKAQGKGVVTGSLAGESKSDVVKGLLKVGRNAAGEQRALTGSEIPLSGATILIFDALSSTTAAETTLTTDRDGDYAAILRPGRYFGFAVHLDLQTFRLVTASIPFMQSVKDTLVAMDTVVAIEDNTGPTVAAVHDATSPDASGLFLAGPIPSQGGRLNIAFSEPMQRESAKGIILGKVNTANVNGSLLLKDTLPAASATQSWSGDGKVLTLTLGRLEAGSRYGLILPTSLKDLAKNPLEKEYRAAFDAVPESQVADIPFTVSSTFPLEKESLKPSENPHVAFSRPPQLASALRSIVMAPETEGYWELKGSRLSFVHKEPLKVGTAYEVLIPDTVADLSGKRLGKAHRWSFTVRDYDGAAKNKTGVEQQVALMVEAFFSAYLQGDVGRIAGMLGQTFRLEADGQILSGPQFVDRIRREGADRARLSAGFLGPVYRGDALSCSTRTALWKVASADGRDTLWVQARAVPGIQPKVYRREQEIRIGIAWSKTESRFTLDGRAYVYDLPISAGSVSGGTDDPRYYGELLRQHTTVVLKEAQDVIRDEFTIDGGITVGDLSAKVAVKLATVTRRGRLDWDPALACSDAPSVDTAYRVVKFILGSDGSRWLFTHAADEGRVGKTAFEATVQASDFKVREIKPIVLSSPVNGINGAADAVGKVVFRFKGLDLDSVGGYLAGLAEDPRFLGGRAAYGGLYFLRNRGKGLEHEFTLGSKGEVVSGATAIVREVQSLGLPGWERTGFKHPIAEIFNPTAGIAGVFNWKVIAVRDTSASQFLSRGFDANRFYGESDFGPNIGAFAARGYPTASDLKAIEKVETPAVSEAAFTDRDLDGFPDHMEVNYKTLPDDKASFPNFAVDTDRDGLADFLELLVDAAGVEEPAGEAERTSFFAALAAKGVKWADADADGFPDDIEKLLGYDPADPASKPATRARVPAPVGVFSGLLRLGSDAGAFPLQFRVREQEGILTVTYSAALKDTLVDSVRAALNEAMGEFLFPIRLPESGPDSGRSLLLRGTYDKNRAFLGGVVSQIPSVARTSAQFGGGPFVGQYAASGRGEDVSGYLGLDPSGQPAAGNAGTANPATPVPAAVLAYRPPPFGVGEHARFFLREGAGRYLRLVMLDEFGDTLAVLDSTNSFPQEDGSFDLNGRMVRTDAARQSTRRVQMDGRLGRGKDSTADIWVLDGSVTVSLDSCRRIESGTANCLDRFFRDVAGQFSLKVPASHASVKTLSAGVAGDFAGWLQQDKFGTGLSGGTTSGTGTTGGSTGGGNTGTTADPVPVQTFAKPFKGTGAKFREFVTAAGIGPGENFYVSMLGRVMRTRNDSLHVREAAFPHCGNVAIKATPIPLLDGATDQEKAAHVRDSILVSGTKYAVLAIDDDAQPGVPARLAKARDALGFVRENVFLIEARYLDPAAFVGDKCIDGGLPPPSPIDAGLPPLPTGAAYYRGDLAPLRNALAAAGDKVTLTPPNGASTVASVNAATLRIDPDTKAAMVADAGDPAINYVLLGTAGSAGSPRMADNRPSALRK